MLRLKHTRCTGAMELAPIFSCLLLGAFPLDADLFGLHVYLDINLDIMTECTTRHTAMD
jgi:hypothetical protein